MRLDEGSMIVFGIDISWSGWYKHCLTWLVIRLCVLVFVLVTHETRLQTLFAQCLIGKSQLLCGVVIWSV
jgi:hypothetical protein